MYANNEKITRMGTTNIVTRTAPLFRYLHTDTCSHLHIHNIFTRRLPSTARKEKNCELWHTESVLGIQRKEWLAHLLTHEVCGYMLSLNSKDMRISNCCHDDSYHRYYCVTIRGTTKLGASEKRNLEKLKRIRMHTVASQIPIPMQRENIITRQKT